MKLPLLLVASIALPAAASIQLTNADASFAQSGYPASTTIDTVVGRNNGWAVAPNENISQRIWWATNTMSAGPDRTIDLDLKFRGASGSASQKFNIRRFSVSVTRDSNPSVSSDWTPLLPISATLNGSAAGMSVDQKNRIISLSGSGTISADYSVRLLLPAGPPITSISIQATPVSGRVGTSSTGNFILTEVEARFGPPPVIVPRDIVLTEGSGPWPLKVWRSAELSGVTNIEGTWSGNATQNADFDFFIPNNFVISLNSNMPQQTMLFTALADALNESPEYIEIQWTPSTNYAITSPVTRVTIGDTNGSGFEDYVTGHGLTGNDALPEADSDADGITNIEAYAFRLNPAGPFPAEWNQRLPRYTTKRIGRTSFPAITWRLPQPYPQDIRFIVEETPNLESWTEIARRTGYGVGSLWTGAVNSSITDSGSPSRQVIVPATQHPGQSPRKFLKLSLQKTLSGGGGGAN